MSEDIYQIFSSRFGEWLDVEGGGNEQMKAADLCMGDFINSVFV